MDADSKTPKAATAKPDPLKERQEHLRRFHTGEPREQKAIDPETGKTVTFNVRTIRARKR